jgi:Arc/MetJ family transcription regulator
MKTTLNIDGQLMAKVKQEAARQGRTMSEFIESALRVALRGNRKRVKQAGLPTFRGGSFRANVADNDALQDFMEGR